MAKIVAIVMSLMLATSTVACDFSVKYVEQGETVPCNGFIFSPKKEKEVRLLKSDYEFLKKELELEKRRVFLYANNNGLLEEMLEKSEEKSKLWRDSALENTKTLVEIEDNRSSRDWLFFVGGILATVGAGYALGQAAK